MKSAESLPPSDDTDMSVPVLENYVGGKFVASLSSQIVNVISPAAQQVLCRVQISTPSEMQAALDAAQSAFTGWNATLVQQRARVMLTLLTLIPSDKNSKELQDIINAEYGKTRVDAEGDELEVLNLQSTLVLCRTT